MVEFRLLGPLEVLASGGRQITIGSGKHRALLAALVLGKDRSVSLDELVDVIWGPSPPARPRNTVQLYVTRLRAALGDAIRTTSDGYQIAADRLDIDIDRFDHLLVRARTLAEQGDPTAEAATLREALALWRGEPLADVPSETLHREAVPYLREKRLLALERRLDVDLLRGAHADLIGELTALTAQHPLRERFWVQLMTALDRCGRRADALDAYHVARRMLADELGIDPGEELRELHAAILGGRSGPSGGSATSPVPRQLPADPYRFTGRTGELARLDALLPGAPGAGRPAVVISAIAGTAGVGKTALASHWGRRVAGEFPDGQLWVNLRGYDPGRTVRPEQALAVLLTALGVPAAEVPLDLDGRVGLYRSLLDGRRMLIVLDNAGSPEQVRPLLPGAPGSLVVVTSRDDLTGLVARDGAVRIRLDLLSPEESVALLRRLLGPATVDNARQAVDELVRLCARLPLALRIAAERIATDPAPLPAAVRRLAAEPGLEAFAAGGDPATALRAVFSWSYDALTPPAARLFRLLGVVPGDEWDDRAAAALAGCPLAEARHLLDTLISAHLVQAQGHRRYGMHDLLRAYAADRAALDLDRDAAWRRLCDHYLGTAVAAADRAFPSELGLPRPPVAVAFDDGDAATGWLDANRAGLVAVAVRAADAGPPEIAWRLADVLRRYLMLNRHLADLQACAEAGLRAARLAGDILAEATMRYGLGTMFRLADQYPPAREHMRAAVDLFGRTDDRAALVAATVGLGSVHADVGELDRARELLTDGVAQARQHGLTDTAGVALAALFSVYHSSGDLRAAAACISEAVEIFRAKAHDGRLTAMLINRSISMRLVGRYEQAERDAADALALSRKHRLRHYEAGAQVALALGALDAGHPELALERAAHGLTLIQEAGLTEYEGATLSALGWAHWALGRDDRAAELHTRALEFGKKTGFVLSELQGLIGLASAQHRRGDMVAARDNAERAVSGARERRFRLSECEAEHLLAAISAGTGDPDSARRHVARAERIERETGYRPAHYMPTYRPA